MNSLKDLAISALILASLWMVHRVSKRADHLARRVLELELGHRLGQAGERLDVDSATRLVESVRKRHPHLNETKPLLDFLTSSGLTLEELRSVMDVLRRRV